MPRKRAKGKKMIGLYLSVPERETLGKVVAKRKITITDLVKEAIAENSKRHGIKEKSNDK